MKTLPGPPPLLVPQKQQHGNISNNGNKVMFDRFVGTTFIIMVSHLLDLPARLSRTEDE